MTPVDKDVIRAILPSDLDFDAVPANFQAKLSNNQHLIYFEFNRQHDCSLSIFKSPNMHEFKIQIPYLKSTSGSVKDAIFKPYILLDSRFNNEASKLFYSLESHYGTFSGNCIQNYKI